MSPSPMLMDKKLSPARLPDESFEDYKTRRRDGNKAVKHYLQSKFGEQVRWLSQFQGKYKKADGPLLDQHEALNLLHQVATRRPVTPLPDENLIVEEQLNGMPSIKPQEEPV